MATIVRWSCCRYQQSYQLLAGNSAGDEPPSLIPLRRCLPQLLPSFPRHLAYSVVRSMHVSHADHRNAYDPSRLSGLELIIPGTWGPGGPKRTGLPMWRLDRLVEGWEISELFSEDYKRTEYHHHPKVVVLARSFLVNSRHNHISMDQAKLKMLRCAREPCDLTKHSPGREDNSYLKQQMQQNLWPSLVKTCCSKTR